MKIYAVCEAAQAHLDSLRQGGMVSVKREDLRKIYRSFESMQATCETWVREAISNNVMVTTLPSTINATKEALSILQSALEQK